MAIPISFLTVILKKSSIEAAYPGGLVRFSQDRPDLPEDDWLVGVSFMSGGELQEFVNSLVAIGFDAAQGLAIGERFKGEWQACAGIAFKAARTDPFDRGWEAYTIPISPERR